MVFHWRLSDRTRLRILALLSSAVIWIVSSHPPTSKSTRPFNNPLVIWPKAPITIGTIVTFMFHSFFNPLAWSRYLSLFSHSFSLFYGQPGHQSRQFCRFSFSFLLIIIRSGIIIIIIIIIVIIIVIIIIYSLRVFHISISEWFLANSSRYHYLVVFQWSLRDNQSPQVSRIFS